jgi:SAM-dependent methyltransferase
MKADNDTSNDDGPLNARTLGIGSSRFAANKRRVGRILKNAGSSVLDIGCGDGRYMHTLLQHGRETYGLDLAPQPYSTNISRYVIKGDARHLPFTAQSFDTVLMINVLEHTDDLSALQEAYRVCRKNVVFSVPHEKEEELGHYNITYHPYVDPTHLRYYTMERVTATFADAGFTMDEICFDGPINSLGLFLRALHLPRLLVLELELRLIEFRESRNTI